MKIGYEQVIASAKRILLLSQTTVHDDELEKLVDWGMKQMSKINITCVIEADLSIECNAAKLPDNVHKDEILCWRLGNGCACGCTGLSSAAPGSAASDGSQTTTIRNDDGTEVSVTTALPGMGGPCGCSPIYASPNVLTDFCGSGIGASGWVGLFDVDGGYIKVPSSCNSTHLTAYYVGKFQDADGLMIIDDDFEAGLAYFCAWQFSLSYSKDLYTPFQVNNWMTMWEAQRGYLAASAQMVDFKKRKKFIRALANAIVVDRHRFNFIM